MFPIAAVTRDHNVVAQSLEIYCLLVLEVRSPKTQVSALLCPCWGCSGRLCFLPLQLLERLFTHGGYSSLMEAAPHSWRLLLTHGCFLGLESRPWWVSPHITSPTLASSITSALDSLFLPLPHTRALVTILGSAQQCRKIPPS